MAEAERLSDGKPSQTPIEERLESWKEIAAFLKRDVRTVQRWEKREGLPVHRHQHEKLGSVYAYRSQLDAWWRNGHERLEDERSNALAGRTADVPAPSGTPLSRENFLDFRLGLRGRTRVALRPEHRRDPGGLKTNGHTHQLSSNPPVKIRRSVAVVGFKNLSGRSDTAWLSTALAEMLTTELVAGEQLRTISGENVARAKNDLSLADTDTYARDTLQRIPQPGDGLGGDWQLHRSE